MQTVSTADRELDTLNLMLGFQVWAKDRGYDLKVAADGLPSNLETRAAWLGYEAAHGPAGCGRHGQQLYALIKASSEYAHQADQLFPVRVGEPNQGEYIVCGGPGGVYRLRDVDLYVFENGKQTQLT